jgi:hypothetical protein
MPLTSVDMFYESLNPISPLTQQDIVAEAMVDWLQKHGYFK